MLARRVSGLTGPSSGAFYELYSQIWYVVIRVLLDTSSRYEVTAGLIKTLCVSCWTEYILQDDTRSLQYQALEVVSILSCG